MPQRVLSVSPLTLRALAPSAFAQAAAEAGFRHVTVRTLPGFPQARPQDMPALIQSAEELRAVKAVLQAEGMAAQEVEFVALTPELDPRDCRRGLAWGAELGARFLVTIAADPDRVRLAERCAALAEEARAFGLTPMIEFIPWTPIASFAEAQAVAEAAGPEVGILLDVLHFARSGGEAAQLAALDLSRVRTFQICDAPAVAPDLAEMQRQALEERLDPGEGGLEVAAMLRALPADLPLNVEVPHLRRAEAEGAVAHLRRLRRAAERLMREVQPV